MESVFPNIYRIHVPLPDTVLKPLNAYLVVGDERNLLIDTGLNHPVCYNTLLRALEQAALPLEKTDVFITHAHVDHCGLATRLKRDSNTVYCSATDGMLMRTINLNGHIRDIEAMSIRFGIPKEMWLDASNHISFQYAPGSHVDFSPLSEGDTLRVGSYNLRVVSLFGHTPGHLGLFEPEHGFLFCGDHILQEISPNIVAWEGVADSIQSFLVHLDQVKRLGATVLFPGHGSEIRTPEKRIDELIAHHAARLAEARAAVLDGKQTVYEITQTITWDFMQGMFQEFPPGQVWFASGETFAHLEHLRMKKEIARKYEAGMYYYVPV